MATDAKQPDERPSGISKALIMETATELFERHGYRGTSLDEVAKRLGVTRQAFYYYYRSKADLLWDINQQAEAHLLRAADAIVQRDLPAQERLRALLESHALVMAEHATAVSVFFQEERSLSEERREQLRRTRRRYTRLFSGAYAELSGTGVVRDVDPELASFLLLGSANWISRWYREGRRWSADEVARTMTDFLLHGILEPQGSGLELKR